MKLEWIPINPYQNFSQREMKRLSEAWIEGMLSGQKKLLEYLIKDMESYGNTSETRSIMFSFQSMLKQLE